MELLNHIRAFHYFAGVLTNQQRDLFCGKCSAWNNSLNNTREQLAKFETEHGAEIRGLSPRQGALFRCPRQVANLATVADSTGQKKAGNCKLPQGVCFVKHSLSIMEKINPPQTQTS
jgi:hypothetical protein